MKPADVGLSPELPYFRIVLGRRTPTITYLHLHECDNFSVNRQLSFIGAVAECQKKKGVIYNLGSVFQL